MHMAVRIRQARRKAGMSQTQLANLIDVRRSAVSNWESVAGSLPSTANLVAIALACDVSFEWLGTGRGAFERWDDQGHDVPAVDADWVDHPEERELLKAFRGATQRRRQIMLEVAREFRAPKRSGKTSVPRR